MLRIISILKEMIFLIRTHKAYFFAPILIVLAILALLAFYVGPTAIIAFTYAGL